MQKAQELVQNNRAIALKGRETSGWKSWSEVHIAAADRAGWRESFKAGLYATLA